MKKPVLFSALLLTALVASACSSTPADYPSLAIRDVERVGMTMATPSAQNWTPPQLGQAKLADISKLVDQAQTAHGVFLETAQNARTTIAAAEGLSAGSNNWSVAQIALAQLQSTRSDALIALADIDRIYVAASTAGEALGQITPAQAEVERLVEQENQVISELAAKLD